MNSSIETLVRECLDACDGDWKKAAKRARRRLDRNPELMDELMSPLIDAALWNVIGKVATKERRRCVTGREGTDDTSGIELMGKRNRQEIEARLMDYPLRGGLKVRHARYDDLVEGSTFRLKISRSNGIEGRWLALIAKQVVTCKQKQVEDVLKEDDLRRLRKNAERG